jgi:uncharacterized protein YegP (UPF0339 family)
MKNTDHTNKKGKSNSSGFRILFREDEKYYFQFSDASGVPILFSRRGYTTDRGCQNGIESLLRVSGNAESYEAQKTKKGKYFFAIKSANHTEIARSAIFDTQQEMQEKMKLLQQVPEDVSVYSIEEGLKNEAPETTVSRQEQKKAPAVAAEITPKPEITEDMMRYKFSVIYYRDSRIWMIKNDYSGSSISMKTCDGEQIQRFLMESLPDEYKEEAKVELEAIAPEAFKAPKAPEKSKAPAVKVAQAVKSPSPKPRAVRSENVTMSIQAKDGSIVETTIDKRMLQKVKVAITQTTKGQGALFNGELEAKSLKNNRRVIIGKVVDQQADKGSFEIPINRAGSLAPGLYLFKVNIYDERKGEDKKEYYSSQVVEIN